MKSTASEPGLSQREREVAGSITRGARPVLKVFNITE